MITNIQSLMDKSKKFAKENKCNFRILRSSKKWKRNICKWLIERLYVKKTPQWSFF